MASEFVILIMIADQKIGLYTNLLLCIKIIINMSLSAALVLIVRKKGKTPIAPSVTLPAQDNSFILYLQQNKTPMLQ